MDPLSLEGFRTTDPRLLLFSFFFLGYLDRRNGIAVRLMKYRASLRVSGHSYERIAAVQQT